VEFAQELSLPLGFFLVLATLLGLPSGESNFTVDEYGKRHYILVPENTNTFLEELSAIISGRYGSERKIFDYDDLPIDSQSLLLLPFVSLFFFELGRGNGKFALGIFVFRLSKPTTLIFLPLSDFFRDKTGEHSKNKFLLFSIFAVFVLLTPQFQEAFGAITQHNGPQTNTHDGCTAQIGTSGRVHAVVKFRPAL